MNDSTDALGTFSLGPGTFMMLRHIDDGGRPLEAEFSCIEIIGGKLCGVQALMKSGRMRLPEYGNSLMLGMLESEEDDCGDWAAGSMTQRWRVATMEEYGMILEVLEEARDNSSAGMVIGILQAEMRELRLKDLLDRG